MNSGQWDSNLGCRAKSQTGISSVLLTYNVEWLEQVAKVFVLLGFESCIDAIDHIIIRLLLLLLHFRKFLEVLLTKRTL